MGDLEKYVKLKGSMMYNKLVMCLEDYIEKGEGEKSQCVLFLGALYNHNVKEMYRFAWVDNDLTIIYLSSAWYTDKVLCLSESVTQKPVVFYSTSPVLYNFVDSVCMCHVTKANSARRAYTCMCVLMTLYFCSSNKLSDKTRGLFLKYRDGQFVEIPDLF